MDNTILAIGAAGEEVDRLSALLGAVGMRIAKKGEVLDEAMMADVKKAQEWLGIEEPGFDGVKGDLIGDLTWKGLEQAARRALGIPAVQKASPPPAAAPPAAPQAPGEPAGTDASLADAVAATAAAGDSEEQPPVPPAASGGRFAQSQA
jgi:hypothetical protein